MAEKRLGWLGPDREVCDGSPLFLSGFFLFFSPFFSLIAEKNTCRFGAKGDDTGFFFLRYYKHKHTKIYTDVLVMIVFACIISTRGCT